MTTRQILIHRSGSLLALLGSLLAIACADESSDDETAETDAMDAETDGSTANESSTGGNTMMTTSPPTTPGESSASGDPETSDTTDASESGAACFGDFLLAFNSFQGDGVFVACDGVPASNCADGYSIVFNDTGECFCIPQCSSLGLSVGDDCTTDGSVVCMSIESDNGESSGDFCVFPDWMLCGP